MSTFQFPVVGANFRPSEAREAIKAMKPGDTVTLEADPMNEYDSSAVKVMCGTHHIGFVPANSNYMVFSRLMNGEEMTATVLAFEGSLRPVCEVDLGSNYGADQDEAGGLA